MGGNLMKKKIILLIISLLVVSLIGCSSQDELLGENQDLIEANVDSKELLNRSEDISDWVVELYGVDDATTIVFNNDAYVAIILGFDQEFTKELEETIIYQIKEKDALIENVHLTTNSKTFSQISDIVFNLLQGQSYDSQVKDINKIIDRF